jgi:hypothetical protein
MRHRPQFIASLLLAILLLLPAAGYARRRGVPHVVHPGQTVDIPGLTSVVARQKCENWAWAAALESILKTQAVDLRQSYWIMKSAGGELCKDDATDLDALAKLITGEYILKDGQKVRLSATAMAGAPGQVDLLIAAPRSGRPLLLFWKGHPYLYRGMIYDEIVAATGDKEFEIRQLNLLDPFFPSAEKQAETFTRDSDDAADINGLLDVVATPVNPPDWQHPEKELDHPTEIYFPK